MDSRQQDREDLKRDYANATSAKEREMISHAAEVISKESHKIESMREALIKARRDGNTAEVKDINEWARTHKDYQNER